jgi:uncharacterized membrane protein YgaE (UPF0421/DUF939 family)
MPWESRGPSKQKYYYRNQRINGKASKVYYGRGELAHQIAAVENSARAENVAHAQEKQHFNQLLSNLKTQYQNLDQLLITAYLLSGLYQQERHAWSKRPYYQRQILQLRRILTYPHSSE